MKDTIRNLTFSTAVSERKKERKKEKKITFSPWLLSVARPGTSQPVAVPLYAVQFYAHTEK